jgi:hypothetical protein
MKYLAVVIWGLLPSSNQGPVGAIQQFLCVAAQFKFVNALIVIGLQILLKHRFLCFISHFLKQLPRIGKLSVN